MRIAVRVEAQRRAREEVKARLRCEGRVKLSDVPAREITAMAEALGSSQMQSSEQSSSPRRRPWSSVGSGGRVEDFPHSSPTTWKVIAARRGEIQ